MTLILGMPRTALAQFKNGLRRPCYYCDKHDCKVQEMYTVQDHPPPPNESLLLPPLDSLYKAHV